MKIDVRRRVDNNSARRHPGTTRTSRNPCGCISRNFCGSAKPAPAAQRSNVHRVFRTIPRAATLVSNRSVACEPQSFSAPPPFEPRIDRLHFVHHPVHSRHLLPSQRRIHFKTSVDALGAGDQEHSERASFSFRERKDGGKVRRFFYLFVRSRKRHRTHSPCPPTDALLVPKLNFLAKI